MSTSTTRDGASGPSVTEDAELAEALQRAEQRLTAAQERGRALEAERDSLHERLANAFDAVAAVRTAPPTDTLVFFGLLSGMLLAWFLWLVLGGW